MTRSRDFGATVSRGVRVGQPDLVVHARRVVSEASDGSPKIGLVVSKAVGNAVQRHRVARRLRHVAASLTDGLQPTDRIVVRALPGSRDAGSARLEKQLRSALDRARARCGARR